MSTARETKAVYQLFRSGFPMRRFPHLNPMMLLALKRLVTQLRAKASILCLPVGNSSEMLA
jgi:hypothetical protein